MANEITIICLLACAQEVLKLAIVRIGQKADLALPAVFAFFVVASLAMLDGTGARLATLGVSGAPLLLFGTVSVVIAPSFFHVFSSVIYWKCERVAVALAFCTVWHVLLNVAVKLLPPLSALAYLAVPWAVLAVNFCIFAAFMRAAVRPPGDGESDLAAAEKPAGEGAPGEERPGEAVVQRG